MPKGAEGKGANLRDSLLSKNFLAALALMTAGVTFIAGDERKDAGAPAVTQEDGGKEEERKKDVERCGVLQKRKDALPGLAFNREKILEQFAVIAHCTDPNAEEFNFNAVCTKIEDGIKANDSKFLHPILNPFYTLLYDELKCQVEEKEDKRPEVLAFFTALQDSQIIAQFSVLDSSKSIGDICHEAVSFIHDRRNTKHIETLSAYIIKNADRLPPESILRKIETDPKAVEKRQKKWGHTPTTQERIGGIKQALEAAAVWAYPALCMLPTDAIVAAIGKFKEDLSPEVLARRRRDALPILREILDLMRTDTDETSAKEVGNAIFALANNLNPNNLMGKKP